jgi:hypothetical protein
MAPRIFSPVNSDEEMIRVRILWMRPYISSSDDHSSPW